MSVAKKQYKRITTRSLVEMKANGEKISMLTAYDYTMAKIVDGAGLLTAQFSTVDNSILWFNDGVPQMLTDNVFAVS